MGHKRPKIAVHDDYRANSAPIAIASYATSRPQRTVESFNPFHSLPLGFRNNPIPLASSGFVVASCKKGFSSAETSNVEGDGVRSGDVVCVERKREENKVCRKCLLAGRRVGKDRGCHEGNKT